MPRKAPTLQPADWAKRERPLSLRQETFARKYVELDGNGGRAAVAAGYSPATAIKQASWLLTFPKIQHAIQQYRSRILSKAEVSAVRVLQELSAIAFCDASDCCDDAGNLLPVRQWPAALRHSINHIEVIIKNASAGDNHQDRVLRVRFTDKTRALELLCKHLGMLIERREVGGPGDFAALDDQELAIRIRDAAERLAGGAPAALQAAIVLEPEAEPMPIADALTGPLDAPAGGSIVPAQAKGAGETGA